MNAILVIALLAGIAWGLVALCRVSLIGCLLGYLAIASCFGHEFLSFKLGPLPLTLDRLALAAVVLVFLVRLRVGGTVPRAWGASEWILLAFLTLLGVSTLLHDPLFSPPKQVAPAWRLLAGYLMPAAAFWIARSARVGEREVRAVHLALATFGVYLAITGILEITRQWSFVFPPHIADSEVGIHFGRARGPMVSSVSFGLTLAVCLLSACVVKTRWGRIGTVALVVIVPLFLAGIYFSYTRSVWLGAALGLLLLFTLATRGAFRVAILGATGALALVVGATRMEGIMALKRETSASDTRDSADLRTLFVQVSWSMFQERPVFGFGFGQFPWAKLAFLADQESDGDLDRIRHLVHHNTFLCLLTETGAVGLALFLALLASWAKAAHSTSRDARAPPWAKRHALLTAGALGVLVCQLLFHELSYSPLDHSLIFFLAGITVGLRRDGVAAVASRARFRRVPNANQGTWVRPGVLPRA